MTTSARVKLVVILGALTALGAAQFGVAGLVGPLFAVIGVSGVSMAAVIGGGLVLAIAMYVFVVRSWRSPRWHGSRFCRDAANRTGVTRAN